MDIYIYIYDTFAAKDPKQFSLGAYGLGSMHIGVMFELGTNKNTTIQFVACLSWGQMPATICVMFELGTSKHIQIGVLFKLDTRTHAHSIAICVMFELGANTHTHHNLCHV